MTHPVIESVTQAIIERSSQSRAAYEQKCERMRDQYPPKQILSCGNMAHAYAASDHADKISIRSLDAPNLGIINAYNDMLSAHQPLATYPDIIREAARKKGATAQVAAGVPAMCDGVTQGQAGMELSLFSRDIIALATVIGLSHNVFDGVLCLGVCDKIVPGMVIGALEFGHLPAGFIPAGPMPSGLSNAEKSAVRQKYAAGQIDREQLLDAESAAYHSPGTCTFYGTANTNQILMEMLGVQLPGASFVNPLDPLRTPLTQATTHRVLDACATGQAPLYQVVTAQSLVNTIVGLMATGGSTNHTLHLVAIAQAAGYEITWQDFDAVSKVTPLLARIYPNGTEDINAFQRAGG
ncbi:MAG: dihydroxy-acid dehydratase, partial [Gammaproteobacteria bacterium]